jgi:hypothetical protein
LCGWTQPGGWAGLVSPSSVNLPESRFRLWIDGSSGRENTPERNRSIAALAPGDSAAPAAEPDAVEASACREFSSGVSYSDEAVSIGGSSSLVQASPESLSFTGLVPLERHLSATRSQFVRGIVLGVLACVVLAIPIFKYANWQQRREPKGMSEQTGLGISGAQTKSDAPGPDLEVASPSLAPSTAVKPKRSVPLSYTPDSPFQPSLAAHRVPSASSHSEGNAAHSTGPATISESKRIKSSATPGQLWGSVQAGNSKAAVALADLYLRGNGVPANCDQARVLLLVASEKNNQEAVRKLRDLDKTGCPSP